MLTKFVIALKSQLNGSIFFFTFSIQFWLMDMQKKKFLYRFQQKSMMLKPFGAALSIKQPQRYSFQLIATKRMALNYQMKTMTKSMIVFPLKRMKKADIQMLRILTVKVTGRKVRHYLKLSSKLQCVLPHFQVFGLSFSWSAYRKKNRQKQASEVFL